MLINGEGPDLIRFLWESKPWIDTSRTKIKNRRPVEGEIPERQWPIIMSRLDEGLPRWCEMHGTKPEANTHLTPGAKGLRSRQGFNWVWNRSVRWLVVPGLGDLEGSGRGNPAIRCCALLSTHSSEWPVFKEVNCRSRHEIQNHRSISCLITTNTK